MWIDTMSEEQAQFAKPDGRKRIATREKRREGGNWESSKGRWRAFIPCRLLDRQMGR
jgi:hypothetical protein